MVWSKLLELGTIELISLRSESEPNLYTKVNEKGKMLIVYMYVDDLIFGGDFCIEEFKWVMESGFEMTNLRFMKFSLGI